MTFLSTEELNRQVSVIKAEMAAYGIGGGLHRESATILEGCDDRLKDLEAIAVRPPTVLSSPNAPIVMSPPRIDLMTPPRQYSYSELEDMKRLQELREESEARIKKAENDIYRAEQEIIQSRTEQAISMELHSRVAEEEALRAAVKLVREASPSPLFHTAVPSMTSPIPPCNPLGIPSVAAGMPSMVEGTPSPLPYVPTHVSPSVMFQQPVIPVGVPHLFGASASPVAVPMVPLVPIHNVSPYRMQNPAVPPPPMESEVNNRVQELLTRAKLKMTCGIELPSKTVMSSLNPSTMCQPTVGSRQPLSPARLQRPLSETFNIRPEEARMRDFRAGEGLLEVLRRQRGAEDTTSKKEEIIKDSEPVETEKKDEPLQQKEDEPNQREDEPKQREEQTLQQEEEVKRDDSQPEEPQQVVTETEPETEPEVVAQEEVVAEPQQQPDPQQQPETETETELTQTDIEHEQVVEEAEAQQTQQEEGDEPSPDPEDTSCAA